MAVSERKSIRSASLTIDRASAADLSPQPVTSSRGPRRGFLRWVRPILTVCSGAISFYLGAVAWNLYLLANSPPRYLANLLNLSSVHDRLYLPGPLGSPATPVWEYTIFEMVVVGMFVTGLWATRDLTRGRGQQTPAVEPSVPYLGPPVDLGFLPAPDHLVGREAELAWVTNRLRQPGSSAITAILGLGGIGKTSLAATAIRQVHDEGRFKDGIVVEKCNGKTDALVVLREALNPLDPSGRVVKNATTEGDLVRAARELVTGKDLLIVLDNVEPELDLERVTQPLRTPGATLLLTARQTLPSDAVPQGATLTLGLLPPDDALRVFVEAFGKAEVTDLTPEQHAAAQRIVAKLERHTLAVRLAGAYAAATGRDLSRLARDLEDDPFKIPRDEEERAVELVIKQSTDKLPEPAKQLFVALAAFATPEIGRNAAQALVMALKAVDPGLGQADPGSTVDLLIKRALVDASIDDDMPAPTDRERLRMHPLVHILARQWFDRWPVSARGNAHRAVTGYYARYCSQAIEPRWLAPDYANAKAALTWAHQTGEQRLVAQLCLGLAGFWFKRGLTADALEGLPWGIDAVHSLARRASRRDRLQRRRDEAILSSAYGEALLRAGRLDDAAAIFAHTLPLFEQLADRQGMGKTLMGLGQVAASRGQIDQAEGHLTAALDIYRKLGDREGEGTALGELGQLARERSRLGDAERFFQQALALARQIENRREEAALLLALGQIAEVRGRLDPAEESVNKALVIHREILDHQGEGVDLFQLGRIAYARGQFDVAEEYAKQALAIHEEVSDRREQGTCLRLLGQIAQARSRLDEAERYLRQAVQISREVDYRRGQGIALTSLGEVVLALRRPDEAEANLRESLSILREVSDRIGYATAALALGALLVSVRNQREEGCALIQEAVTIRHEIGLPDEQKARDIAHQLDCDA